MTIKSVQTISTLVGTAVVAVVVLACWKSGVDFMSAAPLIFGVALVTAVVQWMLSRRAKARKVPTTEGND